MAQHNFELHLIKKLHDRILDEMVKKKFKGLRDSFRKLKIEQLKAERSGASSQPPPSWPWWPFMQWLEPHLTIYDKE